MSRPTLDEMVRIGEELKTPEYPNLYLSFAGEEGFRGAVIVEENNISFAIATTWRLGINPGGEVAFLPAPSVPEKWLNRLLTREEIQEFDSEMSDDG
jgi:hypothetical protein